MLTVKIFGILAVVFSVAALADQSERSQNAATVVGQPTRNASHVRRILVEAAWNYRLPARIGESLQPRLEGQPRHIIDVAWKAQVWLCHRFGGFGHEVSIRTRRVRQSHANYADLSGISERDCNQLE
jgi:hypothetical protein